MLVEDHLHPPEHDHQLLGRENGDLLLKPGMTSSDPVGNSTLSSIYPLVVEGGLVAEEEQDDGVEHDQDGQLQTSAPLVGCAPATEDGKLVTLKSGKVEQKRGNLYFLKPADAGQRC